MRPFLLLRRAPAAIASLAAIGCSVATPDAPDAEAAVSTATAIVVVERTTGPTDVAARADAVIARFVRVRQGAVDEQALRIAGAAWELPAVGTCSATQQPQAALQPRSVDLLDVGVLTLGDRDTALATPKSTVLLPRTMPDPTGVVSGVFYSARAAEAYAPASRLQLHTSGGPDLPEGFLINVASPRDVADVRVLGLADRERALEISWEAAEADDARDLVYVDVLGASSRLVARCTTLDVGHLVIPGASVAGVDDGQVVVHRLHRESFRSKGIDPGEIRFDTARVVTFRR
jgi:hypothetical protein